MPRKHKTMKIIGYLFAGLLVFALVGLAIKLLIYALLAALVIGIFTRPKETLGIIVTFAFIGFMSRYPWPGALLLFALVIGEAFSKKGGT